MNRFDIAGRGKLWFIISAIIIAAGFFGSVNFLVGFSTSQRLPLMSFFGCCDSCPSA